MHLRMYMANGAEEKERLAHSVVEYCGHEYQPTHLLFDGHDYSSDLTVLDEFRGIAFYWNRSTPKGRVPHHVEELMDDPWCEHLVWLSRRALDEEEILFVMILTHELRHLYQTTQGFQSDIVRKVANDLRRDRRFIRLPSGPMSPNELDADLFALRIAAGLFGEDQLRAFHKSRGLPRCPYDEYVPFLEALGSMLEIEGSNDQLEK
jgi:hypothetical protein